MKFELHYPWSLWVAIITSPLWITLTLLGAAWDISKAMREQLGRNG